VLAVALANASIRHSTLADYRRGAEIAEQIELEPDSPRSLCELVDTARVLPMIWRGQLAPALILLDRLSTGEHVEEHQLGILGSPDRRALLAAYASFVRWIVGEYDGAVTDAHRAIELAEANGDPFALGLTYCNLARLRILANDPTDVQVDAERVLAMPDAGIWHSQANILIAWVAAYEGRLDDAAAAELVSSYHERVKRLPLGRSHLVHPVIDALRITQRTAAALALADEVLAHIRQAGERALESELVRVRGELVEPDDRGAAEAAYREALAIARELGAHGLEARAAAGLAKLTAPGP
jgi:tetratricopeptide (TPR) repeat protein